MEGQFSIEALSETKSQENTLAMAKKSGLKLKFKVPVSRGGGNNNKRKSELVLPVRMEKRQRMDRSVKLQCGVILKALMSHPYGFVFNKAVDPVALKIPDYFTIISRPMDFGTIKSKLDDNMYFTAEEFADDARLTFSNALLYNPPDNEVHKMAKDLECIFKSRWKLLEAKLKPQTGVQQGFNQSGSGIIAQEDLQNAVYKKSQLDAATDVAKKSISMEEKQMLRKEVMGMLEGKMTEKQRTVLKKFKFIGSQNGQIDVDNSAFDVAALRELKRGLKGSSIQAMPAKRTQNGVRLMSENVDHKGACRSVNGKPSVSSISSKCTSSGVTRHHFGPQMSIALSSSNGHQTSNALPSSSENSLEDNCHATTTTQDSEVKSTSTHACMSDGDSDGFGSVLDEENTFTSPFVSAPLTPAVSSEGLTSLCDDQSSMKKALRAAMLKRRFAETIIKANGDKSDPRKMKQERERLERLQREEEAKIKARMEEEKLKLKLQRETEREAARILLEKMERTVNHEDNLKVLRELEMFGIYKCRNCLQQLGLYIKEDYMADDSHEEAILNGDREEGEILQ